MSRLIRGGKSFIINTCILFVQVNISKSVLNEARIAINALK